jgi:hypothetical protein
MAESVEKELQRLYGRRKVLKADKNTYTGDDRKIAVIQFEA